MSTCHAYPPRVQCRGSKQNNPFPSLFLEREVHTSQAAAWGVWLLISTHKGADRDFPQSLKELVTPLSGLLQQENQVGNIYLEWICSHNSQLLWLLPKGWDLIQPSSDSQHCMHLWVSQDYSKERSFKTSTGTPPHPHWLYTQAQCSH